MRKENQSEYIEKKFGALKVLSYSYTKTYPNSSSKKYYFNCVCDCGKEVIRDTTSLRNKARSPHCGCLKSKTMKEDLIKKYIGQKYGMLTIVDFYKSKQYPNGDQKNSWTCRCDCGNIVDDIVTSAMTTGNTKSCGCLHKIASVQNSLNSRHKIIKKEAPYNVVFGRYKKGAEARGLSFKLTRDEFKVIIGKNCYYCDSEPSNNYDTSHYSLTYSGIDRLDNDTGYTVDNTIPCCYICNRAKNTSTLDDFLTWALKIGRTAMRIKLSELGVGLGLPIFNWMNKDQEHLLTKLTQIKEKFNT